MNVPMLPKDWKPYKSFKNPRTPGKAFVFSMKTIPYFSRQALQDLNNSYRHLSPEQRLSKCFNSFPDAGILLTSSFGSSAAVLLKLVSEIHPGQEIFFIDTGFHFPETISYKNYLIHLFDLKVTELSPEAETIEFIKE